MAIDGGPVDDPRMRGFRAREPVDAVLARIDARVRPLPWRSTVARAAAGRVLAADVVASRPIPDFDRAAMDGYAVRGEETFGADAYAPAAFRLVGRSHPGRPCGATVGPGQAVAIATGAPMPGGADAVVRVEAARAEGGTILVVEPTPPGRHVGRRGEDVAAGAVVLREGRVLRPQDLGLLNAMGIRDVDVVRKPRVAVLITGDELARAGRDPEGQMIADANSPMLAALIARDGGLARVDAPLADDRDLIREVLDAAADSSDAVLVAGGTSAGPEDFAPGVVAELGELVTHGVALRPASPTGLGFVRDVPVLLLPGNPVSCLCAYDFFAGRVIRLLGGRAPAWPYRSVELPLSRKLASAVGRVDYARVRVEGGRVEPLAIGGASILSSTTRADGFVVVPADLEGYPEGATVTAWLYDR